MKDKILKIIASIGLFLSMFIGSFSPVFASTVSTDLSGVVIPTMDDIKALGYDATKYPYYAVFFSYENGNVYDWACYEFVASAKPFVINETGDGFIADNGDLSHVILISTMIKKDDPKPFNLLTNEPFKTINSDQFKLIDFGFETFSDMLPFVITSSHDIKDKDGNVVFQQPPTPFVQGKGVEELVNQTTLNSQVIVGSTICLVVLGICLAGLVKRFRHLAQA